MESPQSTSQSSLPTDSGSTSGATETPESSLSHSAATPISPPLASQVSSSATSTPATPLSLFSDDSPFTTPTPSPSKPQASFHALHDQRPSAEASTNSKAAISISRRLSNAFASAKKVIEETVLKKWFEEKDESFLQRLQHLSVYIQYFERLIKHTKSIYAHFPDVQNPAKVFLETRLKPANKLYAKEYKPALSTLESRIKDEEMLQRKPPSKIEKLTQAKDKAREAEKHYIRIRDDLKRLLEDIDDEKFTAYEETIQQARKLLQSIKPEWNPIAQTPEDQGKKDVDETRREEPPISLPLSSDVVVPFSSSSASASSSSSNGGSGVIDVPLN